MSKNKQDKYPLQKPKASPQASQATAFEPGKPVEQANKPLSVLLWILVGLLIVVATTLVVVALFWWPWRLFYRPAQLPVSITKATATNIAAVGDISCSPTDPKRSGADPTRCQDPKVASLIANLKPQKLLLLGDIQYDTGSLDAFNQTFATNWGQFKSITLPAPGNHEYGTKNATGYFAYFGNVAANGYYTIKVGNWTVYSLNSNCPETNDCGADSAQIKWLQQQLDQDHNTCQLAFWHHPQFSSGQHSVEPNQVNRLPIAWQLLQDHHAELVLNGHDHIYERFDSQLLNGTASPDGIREIIVGSGGNSHYKQVANRPNSVVFNNSDFGVLALELYSGSYNWKFVATDGRVLDQGGGKCK